MRNDRLKYIIEGIVIIAVVLLIAFLASQGILAPSDGSRAGAGTGANAVAQAVFPSDIPIPASGPVQGSSSVASSGQFQLTRSFESTGTVATDFTLYKNYLSNAAAGGWAVLAQWSKPSDPDHKAILARNADGMLTINISSRSASASLVEMMFVGNP